MGFFTETTGSLRNPETRRTPSYEYLSVARKSEPTLTKEQMREKYERELDEKLQAMIFYYRVYLIEFLLTNYPLINSGVHIFL